MPKTYNIEPIKQALQTAKNILILLPQNPSLDSVAAGLALYLSLVKTKRQITIGCASQMTVGFNRLFGVDKIKPDIGNQNLVISFNYPEDSLEKVAYDKDPQNQKFHLTIEPKTGFSPPDPQSVKFSHSGYDGDLIFVIGASKLEDLGALYQAGKKLFTTEGKTIVNLSSLDKSTQFGTVNIYDPTASGSCEIMLSVLTSLELPQDADIATNLLVGIEANTNNLSTPNLSADTFEIVAQLMRQGAKKGYISPTSPISPPPISPPVQPARPSPFSQISTPPPTSTPANLPSTWPKSTSPIVRSPVSPVSQPSQIPSAGFSPTTPSPDWLKPKVLKSSDPQA